MSLHLKAHHIVPVQALDQSLYLEPKLNMRSSCKK